MDIKRNKIFTPLRLTGSAVEVPESIQKFTPTKSARTERPQGEMWAAILLLVLILLIVILIIITVSGERMVRKRECLELTFKFFK
ncbi:MAG: hypothetical protein Q8R00_05025 [Candidatus Nanoarchaeia archaeon]|nr:hypothetical protein [Candidatus Nanoarchaeia archaeon]